MELVLPSVDYKASYIAAVKEAQADSDTTDRTRWYKKFSVADLEKDFEACVQRRRDESEGRNLPEGYVPHTEYWLVDGGAYIGGVNIRHRLNEHLEKFGGHIGYDIRPSMRGKGYGSKILELALPKAKELGITRALVTCNADNTASRKIIEKNGGVYENTFYDAATGIDKLRFWIDLSVY